MKQYFKIGEISKLYHIGVDSLRYYEKLGIITPERAESGYRLYRLHDIWRLNVIRDLRELDFSMDDIQRYLKNHSVDSTLVLLEAELSAIHSKLSYLQQLQDNVEQRLQTLQSARHKNTGIVELIDCPVRHLFSIPGGYKTEEEMDVQIKQLLNIDPEHFYVIGNNQIGSVISLVDAQHSLFRKYSSVFLIDKKGDQVLNSGTYLTLSYAGSCEQNAIYIPRLLDYAKAHRFKPTGDILELLWVDIHTSDNMKEHITELQMQVQ